MEEPKVIMDSNDDPVDDPVSSEDISIVFQPEIVSNSENKKKSTESCIKKVVENESELSQYDKEILKVLDETKKLIKETTIAYEKDSFISNIEVNDSNTCSETVEEYNTEIEAAVEVVSSENGKNNAVETTEENTRVESSCKENESIHVAAEMTELDISNLTDICDPEISLALNNSCKVQDDTINDNRKSTDDVADESETSSKENTKDCDIPDESSDNADDMQVLQIEAALEKKVESESSDSNLENSEKDVSEKNIEPENTEFIQFPHDKQDDSQIEGQSIDAEDPFGGDNLTSENVEQVETDSLENGLSFKKIYEQGNNLQDAVNARNNDCNEKLSADSALNDPKDADDSIDKDVDNIAETSNNVQTTIDTLENTSMDIDLPDTSTSEIGAGNMSSTKSHDGQNEQAKKNIEEIPPMETDEEQTNVLPGQDDELCIIPDSMKVIIPNKSGKTIDDNQSESVVAKDSEYKETIQKSSKSNSELQKNISQNELVIPNENKAESTVKQKATIPDKSATKDLIPATDVINIDDEKTSEVEEISKEVCKQCGEERACKIQVKFGTENHLVCSKTCKALFKAANSKVINILTDDTSSKREKRCASCLLIIDAKDERNLSWETMEFCNEECLGKFQRKYGSYCKNCNGTVQAVSLGKYCVRFGCDVRQFCCSTCLEEFKKGLKVCSYCQKDISFSTDGFLAPVGEKGQFKDFCTQDCMEKYSKLNSMEPPATEKKPCSVCKEEKLVHCEVQIYNSTPVAICSEPCFAAFKFVKQVKPEQCSTCKKFFELPNKQHFIVFYENEPHTFCNKTCLNIFIITNRKIVPCNWCKVKKYNFDMIKKELSKTGQILMMCSLNCLTLYQVSINAVSAKRINCDLCKEYSLAHYHLTMSDATIRNFCSYNCVMNFQAQYTKSPITIPSSDDPVPTGLPKRTTLPQRSTNQIIPNEIQNKKTMPVISSVTSLATMGNGSASPTPQQNSVVMSANASQTTQMVCKQQVITRPPSPVKVHNKSIQCKPIVHTKGVYVRPHPCTKATQTTETVQQVVVPIPVPIYVPFPMHMYSMPFPVPMPFPLPIPVPLFIPTTRNSAKGIMKDIKKIQEKIPADPYEAELLMMAEMVATGKKINDSDSDSVGDREDDTAGQANLHSDGFSPEAVDSSNAFGDDMLQMALKMATGEIDEPAVDLEAALTPNTITATQAPPENALDNDVQSDRLMVASRGRKRVVPYKPRSSPAKRMRRVSGTNDVPLMPPPESQPLPQPRIMEPIEKPDANMALKYTFGVNAWRQWVVGKNAELEKQITTTRKIKFKTDLLQLTADELNYSLCLFVKEVRKPNGAEYAPDTIYYLCLGIQQYLFENHRIDNIFTDPYYEKFTDCLNEVAKKFSVLFNDARKCFAIRNCTFLFPTFCLFEYHIVCFAEYIVTRVEEEHLWECKQLGAHSPHVLLSTLMFFNTKHFNLITVDEHMQLSFSHIMKHWKRNPAAQPPTAVAGKVPGSRNVLLRFYPPQSALEANSRKKKVYEQQENEENALKCPVKLYEFYLSKCPESVKTRNDVFYLLPERSCVPDSPVWYSTSPLAKEQLIKMLHRIKMVKEINVALLSS
ncbi:ZMYM3 protein, partial [Acromyrmex charruanus]